MQLRTQLFQQILEKIDLFSLCQYLRHQYLPYLYINKLEDINAILGQQQLENILATLYLLDNNKPDKLDTIKNELLDWIPPVTHLFEEDRKEKSRDKINRYNRYRYSMLWLAEHFLASNKKVKQLRRTLSDTLSEK